MKMIKKIKYLFLFTVVFLTMICSVVTIHAGGYNAQGTGYDLFVPGPGEKILCQSAPTYYEPWKTITFDTLTVTYGAYNRSNDTQPVRFYYYTTCKSTTKGATLWDVPIMYINGVEKARYSGIYVADVNKGPWIQNTTFEVFYADVTLKAGTYTNVKVCSLNHDDLTSSMTFQMDFYLPYQGYLNVDLYDPNGKEALDKSIGVFSYTYSNNWGETGELDVADLYDHGPVAYGKPFRIGRLNLKNGVVHDHTTVKTKEGTINNLSPFGDGFVEHVRGNTDVFIYTRWAKVVIDPNGGLIDGSSEKITKTATKVDDSFTLPIPTKENCTFLGWQVEGGSVDGNTYSYGNEDGKLTAIWSTPRRTITFDPNGGTMNGNDTVLRNLGNQVNYSNGSITFEGTRGDFLEIAPGNLNLGKSVTLLGKFRWNNLQEEEYFSNFEYGGVGLAVEENFTLRATVNVDGNYKHAKSKNKISANTDYWIGMTYDGSTIRLYVNGEEWASLSYSGSITPSKLPFILGGNPGPDGTNQGHSKVTVYKAGVWNRTLSQSEIKSIQNNNSVSSADIGQADFTVGTATKTNYKFEGWYTEANGGEKITDSTTVNNDATYYAHWTGNQYTVSYDANGGSGTMSDSTATYGSSFMTRENVFTREGYTFNGWNESQDGSGTAWSLTSSGVYESGKSWTWTYTKNITLYAQWKANTYTVAYNGNGNTGGSTASSTHTYDVAKALTANGFTRAYTVTYNYNGSGASNSTATATYTFKNWNTAANGSGIAYADKASVTNLASKQGTTVTLYAQWNSASVTLPMPTRTGYTFGGWYQDSTCTVKVGDAGAVYTPKTAITLYAKWTANHYKLTVNPNSGKFSDGVTTAKILSTDLIFDSTKWCDISSVIPSKTGYTLTGFYTAASGGTKVYNADGKATKEGKYFNSANCYVNPGDLTVYAQWTANHYKLTVNPNSGKFSDGVTTAKTLSTDLIFDSTNWCDISSVIPSKTGYTLTGFYTAASGGTKVYNADGKATKEGKYFNSANCYVNPGNLTVYAQWKANQYTVTIHGNGGTLNVNDNGITKVDSSTARFTVTFDQTYFYSLALESSRTGYTVNGIYDATSGGVKLWNNGGKCLQDGKYWNSSNQWKYPGNVDLYFQYTPITYTNKINHWITGLSNEEGQDSSKTSYLIGVTSFNVTYKDTYDRGPAVFAMNSSRMVTEPNGTKLNSTFYTSSITGTKQSLTMPQNVNQLPKVMEFDYYYSPVTYRITYDLNDGTGTPESRATNSAENPSTYNVFYGFTLKEPTRTGYTFKGWVDESGNLVKAINEGSNMEFVKTLTSGNGTAIRDALAKRTARDITLTATWTPTNPELAVRKTTYFQNQNITPDILKKNATAVDILEGDISDKIIIKSIEYDDGTVVTDPAYLDTSKEQTAKITYYVENQRGGSIEKSQTVTVKQREKGHPEDPTDPNNPGTGGQASAGEDYDGSRIFSRYIREDCIYTLPGNSIWKTDTEYNDLLDSMNKGSEDYLTQYDSLLND